MKTNKALFLIVCFFSLFLPGCSDFLEIDYQGGSTKENFYDTPYKLEKALNATFDILQSITYNNCEWAFGESCGDDVTTSGEGGSGDLAQLVNFTFNTSNIWIRNRYEINYKGIYRANQVIANAGKVQLSSTDYASYTEIREILGQAKFLRALFYFNLVKTYGGVPIRPEEESVNKLTIPRNTKEEVYQYIEKDLREAAIMLKPRYVDADLGRIGSGAAIALLMKVLMYQSEPGISSSQWEEMVRLGEYFVDGKNITYGDILKYDTYTENWDSLRHRLWFKPKELLSESEPYEISTTSLPSISNSYGLDFADAYGEAISYHEIFYQKGEFYKGSVFEVQFKESATGTSDDAIEGTSVFDDLFYDGCWPSTSLLSELDGDPRRNEVALQALTLAPDGIPINVNPNKYGCMKWYTPLKERPLYDGDNGKNRRVIRYAEVILMYAEALNECGEGQRALTQLNKTKNQANKITNSQSLYLPGGYGYMRNQIWKERRIELCHEWDRFFDIVRQKRAAKILHELGLTTVYARGWYFVEDVNEIFPIPQVEIDLTNGVVAQNPGY